MTPKEKAEELVEKFTDIENEYNEYSDFKQAKQCALIAVNEIIKVACDYSDYDETVTKEYWEKVKIEIDKL